MYDNKRNGFIDYLRGIAIVLVVLGHCIQFGQGNAYYVSEAFFENIVFNLDINIIAMISGLLLTYSKP